LPEAFCNIGAMPDAPVTELVLSPRWSAAVHHVDGVAHVVLRIEHPRAGALDFLLPGNDPMDLAAALAKTAERRDEARIGSSIPMDPGIRGMSAYTATRSGPMPPPRGRLFQRRIQLQSVANRISLQRASAGRKIVSKGPGIWRMSD